MRFYTYIFILVVTRSISNDVYCELGCDNSRNHVQNCQAYCNSVWGRAPLLNKPYSHGACFNNDCICKFNTIELQPYADQCAHRSVWGSIGSNKKFAEQAIKATTIRMDARQRFDVFKKSYGKKYSSKTEEQRRFAIFNENLIKIEKLMATRKGSVVYGVGPYTDWTSEEYMKSIGVHYPMSKTESSARLQPRMLSSGRYKRNRSMSSEPPFRTPKRGGSEPPYQSNYYFGRDPQGPVIKDWRVPAHLYPPYQSQFKYVNGSYRKCGACMVFAAVGALEILLAHAENKLTLLSRQSLIDCDRNNDGCDGGYIHNALAYIQQYGTPTSRDYPYVAAKGACKGNIRSHASITDFVRADKRRLEEHLLVSPIPTVMHARPELQYYVSGVYDSDDCPNDLNKVNHGVVIVGHYADAWILRDSQPGAWGQQVYNIPILEIEFYSFFRFFGPGAQWIESIREGHLLMKKGICAIGEASYELRGPYVVPPPRKKFRLLSREKSQGSS